MGSGQNIQLKESEIKQIIYDYTILKLSTRQIAKKFNIKCHKSIKNILNKNNIKIRSQKEAAKLSETKFTENEINLILKLYENPEIGITELGKNFNHDPQTIKKLLCKYSVYNADKFDNFLINKFNIIDSEEKAYWLGFLAADGNLSKKQLTLLLAEKDKNHLLKFKKFINVDYKVSKKITTLKNKKFVGYRYSVSSIKFIESLFKHNLYPNKSATISIPPTIPYNLLNHYIRGIFDGDGSYYIKKTNNQITFSIISSFEMCSQIQNILIDKCNVSKNKLYIKNNKLYCYLTYVGNNQNKRIYNYIYNNSNIFLERKRNVFINHYSFI